MTGVLLAVAAGAGAYLLWTATALGWRGVGPSATGRSASRRGIDEWLRQAGLGDVRLLELLLAGVGLAALGGAAAWALFAGVVAPVVVGGVAGALPVVAARGRRARRMAAAREAWPGLLEEIRLLAVASGQSLPQALLAAGRRGPVELRPAFEAAEREWFLTTDFERCVAVLRSQLADPTADAVCETLLVAHEVGGSDVDARLAALAEDRAADLQSRKDAAARQAGARFARRFTLGVPLGMAVAGLSIGDGRAAFASPPGQVGVAVAMALTAFCWWWAGRIMRLPEAERVFAG